jgi:hypothetical protein
MNTVRSLQRIKKSNWLEGTRVKNWQADAARDASKRQRMLYVMK